MALFRPTEMRYWKKNKTYDGYTLFRPANGRVYLIYMEGSVVNTWEQLTNPLMLENGNIWGGFQKDIPVRLKELDWKSTLIDCPLPTERFRPHMVRNMQKNDTLGVVRRSLIGAIKK